MKVNIIPTEFLQETLSIHKELAKQERLHYRNQCQSTTEPHITIDFAQSFHIPYFTRQPIIL